MLSTFMNRMFGKHWWHNCRKCCTYVLYSGIHEQIVRHHNFSVVTTLAGSLAHLYHRISASSGTRHYVDSWHGSFTTPLSIESFSTIQVMRALRELPREPRP